MVNTPDIICSGCGDSVSVTVAKIVEDDAFASSMDDVRYLCPVCVIQARNAHMQETMHQAK